MMSMDRYRTSTNDATEMSWTTRYVSEIHREALSPDPDITRASYVKSCQETECRFGIPSGNRGPVSLRFPRARTLAVCSGVSQRKCADSFFHGDANYHTDEIAANKLGFAQIVVGGKMTMSYTAHVLEEHYGERWWLSGQLDIKFTNPAWCDDVVTVRGVDTGTSADGDRDTAFVWISKEDGTVILIANASVALA